MSERRTLDGLIARAEPDSFTHLSLVNRREAIEAELARLEAQERVNERQAEVALYFGGGPVVGSDGVQAEFAARAVESFQSLVAKVAATRAGKQLGSRGRIPGAAQSRLYITDTALGSFGLVLRELPGLGDQEALFTTDLRASVDEATQLLADIARDDEAFADAAAENDQMVMKALGDFLRVLRNSGATLRAESRSARADLDDTAIIETAFERVELQHIVQTEERVLGELYFLPNGRQFELLTQEGALRGRVSKEIDIDALRPLLMRPVSALVRVTAIAGRAASRRHLLLGAAEQSSSS